jgi:hypothetical protein
VARAYGVDMMTQIAVIATAVSQKRAVTVEVSSDSYVIGVRPLNDAIRRWDSQTLEFRIKSVPSVSHDQYLAGRDATNGRYPTTESVAAAALSEMGK